MKQLPLILSFFIAQLSLHAQQHTKDSLSNEQIREIIKANSLLNGASVPKDIRQRLGATHTSGKYFLTEQPFLIEGAKKIDSLGFGILKLWFYKTPQNSYPYHTEWNFPKGSTLKQFAQHAAFRQVFSMPFSTIILSTSAISATKMTTLTQKDFDKEEEELYELCSYLLKEYSKRNLTFIIQNWEGDWIYRGGTDSGSKWNPQQYPDNIEQRNQSITHWFQVRQRAVERARKDNKESKCKLYHAIEVNKVFDCMKGIPGLVTDVLPKLKVDMVSWSCYDGLAKEGIQLYKGIEYIRQHMQPSDAMKEKTVFIGEIGIPENVSYNGDSAAITKAWDNYMAVMLAQKTPYVVQWELYCNETKDGSKGYYPIRKEEDMRGFWLLKPDGSKSIAMHYLEKVLQHAGKTIND